MRSILTRSFVGAALALLSTCELGPHPTRPVPQSAPFQPPPLGRMEPVTGSAPAPYQSVCRSKVLRVTLWVHGTQWVSSGALLDDNLLLTAGHNYATLKSIARERSVECGMGVVPEQPWFSVYDDNYDRHRHMRHPAEYPGAGWAADYALLWFGTPASRPSSFRLPEPGQDVLLGTDSIVTVAGYPSEGANTGSLMFHGRGKVIPSDDEDVFYYSVNTEKGMSGSPVWVERNGEFILVGVHVGGDLQRNLGIAHRLNSRSLQNIARWSAGFPRAP
ncbi:MAG TPA: trypsin-like peptidase domain-containing protein [Longimicrobium sp.]